ncbi:hypothetical protein [Thalassomonas sp. RHCl1]|uniref:hypothetical protein n=1 Tax=Thalassomonas sp. RHCl1 TaxID=2995320 RepID=UPI00248D03E5|nr:hypothetical protein [Thalassomonas sp. RHCl1]
MKVKHIVLGMVAALSGVSVLASEVDTGKYQIDTDKCAGTEYIYDEQQQLVKYDPAIHTFVTEETAVFYSGSANIPHIRMTSSNSRGTHIYVVNNQNQPVNLFFQAKYFSETSGDKININPGAFAGIFSTSNDPLKSSGAQMPAESYGLIGIQTNVAAFGTGTIKWDASSCFDTAPITATLENYFNGSSGRYGSTIYMINGGNPF